MKTGLGFAFAGVVFVAGCQVPDPEDPPADLAEQAVTVGDCYGQANYCNATFPPSKPFTGGLPAMNTTTLVLIEPSPIIQGQWSAIAADWAHGVIPWVRTFPTAQYPQIVMLLNAAGRSFTPVQPWPGVRPPPPPPPGPFGYPGAVYLEKALRVMSTESDAYRAFQACGNH